MRIDARFILLASAALALSGCQSPLLKGWGFNKKAADGPTFARADANGILALEEGRVYLRQGQISAAVASFKIAQLDPETAPDATNGLGVAYSKLGRPDLADRYFRQAIALRPSDDRFAANLLRLQRDVMLARGTGAEATPVLSAQQETGFVASARSAVAPAERKTAKSQPEYRVVTGAKPAPAPVIQVGTRQPAPEKQDKEAVEVEATDRLPLLSRLGVEPLEVAF